MAAIYGLNYSGEAPNNPFELFALNKYKSKLDKSFSNLLIKYGITLSELNNFNLDNLVSVPEAKKLPTTCP